MRIAHVICAGTFGGAEAVASALTHGLVELGEHCVLYVVRELRAGADACDDHALVVSSDSEGSPMVVLEAMAHGTPVVARAVGGIGDLVHHDREGLLLDGDRPAQMADAIAELAGDLARRTRLGQAGWSRATGDLAPRGWALRHRELYRELVRSD
jgi:glycosyltransferase involved in cell wall biosynthesis